MVSTFNGSTGVGLEPSAEGIRLLQKKHANCASISFVQGSAHQLPFSSNSFDLVVAWSVLHWIGRDEYLQALGELIRVTSSILLIMDFDPLDSYRTPYVHNPDFHTFKHDFEPLDSRNWNYENNRLISMENGEGLPSSNLSRRKDPFCS